MHLSDRRIDAIVKVKGLPRCAPGRSTFTNGEATTSTPTSRTDARTLASSSGVPPTAERRTPPRERRGAIHERLGCTEFARREYGANAAFRCERVTARPKNSCAPARPDVRPQGGASTPA